MVKGYLSGSILCRLQDLFYSGSIVNLLLLAYLQRKEEFTGLKAHMI